MLDYLSDYFTAALNNGATCGNDAWALYTRALGENDEQYILLFLLAIGSILAQGIHEFGHAWMADKLGDPQPRKDGRVSLAPWAHFSPLGFLMIVASTLIGFPVGWGKALKTDPETYVVPRRTGIALVALAGPLMSLLGAVILSVPARMLLAYLNENGGGLDEGVLIALIVTFVIMVFTLLISVSLFVFNFLPLHPMDGAHILASVLPHDLAVVYVRVMKRYGTMLFLGLLASGILGDFLAPIILAIFQFLMGV